MSVYVEYAVIDNMVFDYLLLKAALKTGRVKFGEIQLIATAAAGTFFALFFPLMNVGGAAGVIFKIVVGEVMVLAAGKYVDIYSYIRTLLFFLFYTFAVGGAMIGICYLLGLKFDSEAGFAL
ncbi:MAG: sigma-E processing peptidase SpoIIGA, partial [Clostridia bacterium]|nr:sigma-E processing peptidase SpoIIGA [Clostridia bacterium]